ncbi:MAG: restriction endonuclease [Eubacteriaceae bacterium]|nr:restriction endonuclease [Eubacteriaceae bacterium]
MAKYKYSSTVSNSYLGETKTITGTNKSDVYTRANKQIEAWAKKEATQRERDRKANDIAEQKREADSLNAKAKSIQQAYSNILKTSLDSSHAPLWGGMKHKQPYIEFEYNNKLPSWEEYRAAQNLSQRSFLENAFKSRREERMAKEAAAEESYNSLSISYNTAKEEAYRRYLEEKNTYETKQKAQNDSIEKWKADFEKGEIEAVERYILAVLDNSKYPLGIRLNGECSFDLQAKSLIVSVCLPTPEDIPNVIGYKYVANRNSIDPIMIKPKDKNELYESTIHQITLRIVYELFAQTNQQVDSIVFNGWVTGINKATGIEYTACLISVQFGRKEFDRLNLKKADPKECLRSFKALSAGALHELTPVRPIMELNREDRRFISPVDVLDAMDSDTNLATMPWDDFEHLVRELFSRIFSRDGAEVHVTQASRDGGVDAIAFDPDPIMGGKYVIQAKRYKNVVPVSACRDLYGTMINEGAVKGILVTTSHYGNDSREFVKDKPISLIDGSNLLHMLSEYGYSFTIDLTK